MSLSVTLSHAFDRFALDVAFEAPRGITVLFGRSGSGKTTLINAVAGLLKPDRGRIAVDDWVLVDTAEGRFLPPHRRRLGYIFQDARLFPHMSVEKNLLYGRRFAPSGAPRMGFDAAVEMLDIGPLLQRRPGDLSGGEKQRVAIGRALLAEPRLILADEPLASLDAARKAEILPHFERLRDEVSVPILYVTHAVEEVARLATTVVTLEAGRVAHQGPAVSVLGDPMATPVGVRAAGALLEAKVIAHHDDGLSELDAGGARLFLARVAQPPGRMVRVRIAAHEVILSRVAPEGLSALNILDGVVEAIRPGEGPGAIVSVRTKAGTVLARVTRRSVDALALAPGSQCHAIIKTVAIASEDIGAG
ncbi:MAG: molybdenum ABC transporter ATP-binding protein [Pseudomonadota bacterium]